MSQKSSSRMRAEDRRIQLLESAAKVFALHGYAGTTTAELAKAAGITEPIIYRHFKGKKELFIALIEETGRVTIAEWEQALRDASDPAERLKRLISANPMVFPRGRAPYRVLVQAMMQVEDSDIRHAIHDHVRAMQVFLASEIKLAQEQGQVSKRFSPEITAWVLIEIALGYGVLSAAHVPGHSIDPNGHNVQDLIGMLMLGERYQRGG